MRLDAMQSQLRTVGNWSDLHNSKPLNETQNLKLSRIARTYLCLNHCRIN